MDDDEPSEMDESEEEIEEIVTEGARGLPTAADDDPASEVAVSTSASAGAREAAAATGENKLLDHRVTTQAVTGMHYQTVVHRVETISTTTLPVGLQSEHAAAAEKQVRRASIAAMGFAIQ